MRQPLKQSLSIICILICLSLILNFTGCKKNNTESTVSDDTEVIYEYIDETGDYVSESKINSDAEEKDNNASSSTPNNKGGISNTANSGNIFKSMDELYEANPAVGSIITLDIAPYAKGEYKVVSGSYPSNDVSIVYISTGKYAIRNVTTLNKWVKDVPYGSFIAHQGFNGSMDNGTSIEITYPTNTVEAVEHAVRLGYKMVEIDITITKDKVWVVDHDANSKAINNTASDAAKNFTNMMSGVITKKNILRKYKGSGAYWEFSNHIAKEKTPTLESVFKSMQNNNAYLILDNKYLNHHQFTEEEYDILAELIKKYNMQNRCAAYAGCLEPLAKRVNGIILCYSEIPDSDHENAYKIMSSYGNFMLSVGKTKLADYTAFAKKYNVPLAVWVEDKYYEADKLFSAGANYVLSNYCLPDNANLSDYKEIKSLNISDFKQDNTTGTGNVAVTSDSIALTASSQFSVNLPVSYKELGLHPGDILVLSAEGQTSGGEGFIKISASDNVEAKRTVNGKNTVYYIIPDTLPKDVTVSLGLTNGSATFKNIKLSIMRESARGEQ